MATETIGFIGLGHMGEGMARRLLNVAGRKLVVWNRSAAKSKALEAEAKGAVTVAESPAAVVRACAVTFVMLSEPMAVKSVYEAPEGILAGVSAGKSIVDCATLAVADMERLSAQVLGKGGRFLEAPVSGSKAPAAQGQVRG
jgi:3-hydroxyisobutyrate dehydrogenase-like beta-hydroxyacid dehydrogenase